MKNCSIFHDDIQYPAFFYDDNLRTFLVQKYNGGEMKNELGES